jgi:hypothetical protein
MKFSIVDSSVTQQIATLATSVNGWKLKKGIYQQNGEL